MEKRSFVKRHSGGGSVMVRVGLSEQGKTNIFLMERIMIKHKYINALEDLPPTLCILRPR